MQTLVSVSTSSKGNVYELRDNSHNTDAEADGQPQPLSQWHIHVHQVMNWPEVDRAIRCRINRSRCDEERLNVDAILVSFENIPLVRDRPNKHRDG